MLTNISILSVFVQIAITVGEYMGYFYVIFIQIFFSVWLVMFTTIFLKKYSEREKLISTIWGESEDCKSEQKMTKITTFTGPYYFDIFENQFEPLANKQNAWRAFSWITMLLLFAAMSATVMYIIELKSLAMKNGDEFWTLIYGLLVSISIKL